jgi:flagellar motor component MotA
LPKIRRSVLEDKIMNENSFTEEYNAIFERALIFSIISRSIGLVSLNNLLNKEKYNQRDIFEYGMRMVMDGRTPELIDKILTNIINLETDKERKFLKNIQKDAVLSIQQGISSEELMRIMNSYVNIELDKAEGKYNIINEYISKEITNEFRKFEDNQTDIYKCISEKIVNELYKRDKNT